MNRIHGFIPCEWASLLYISGWGGGRAGGIYKRQGVKPPSSLTIQSLHCSLVRRALLGEGTLPSETTETHSLVVKRNKLY